MELSTREGNQTCVSHPRTSRYAETTEERETTSKRSCRRKEIEMGTWLKKSFSRFRLQSGKERKKTPSCDGGMCFVDREKSRQPSSHILKHCWFESVCCSCFFPERVGVLFYFFSYFLPSSSPIILWHVHCETVETDEKEKRNKFFFFLLDDKNIRCLCHR